MPAPTLRIVAPAPVDDPHADAPVASQRQAFGPFVLDPRSQQLLQAGVPVALRPRPYALLVYLVAQAGRLVSKDEVLDAVWGHRHVSHSVLKVAINTLRSALGDDSSAPRYIETASRRGYRFVAAVQAVPVAQGALAMVTDRPGWPLAPATATPAAAAAAGAACGNLPAAVPGLVGRDAERAQLQQLLATQRLVTVVGPGGVGKTRLALAAGAAHAPADGVWLVRLDMLADAAPLVETVARALALSGNAGRNSASLAQALAPLKLRIVIDNAEHLIDAVAAEVSHWLQAAPQLQVLVTSQLPLRLNQEQVFALAPLAAPPENNLRQAHDYAAYSLFVAHARLLQPGFNPDAAMTADIAALCRMLDGLPLALELAAARVPGLGTAGVRARMADRFELLSRGPRDAPERHRTLRAALEWSVALLSDAERRVLRRLAVFAGGFTPELAQSVAGDPGEDGWALLERLEDLRERSLVVADGAGPTQRWRLLDSVRALALQQLTQAGELQATRWRHALAMNACFAQGDAAYVFTPLVHWLAPLRLEADNLRAALEHVAPLAAHDPAAADLLLQLYANAAMFWSRAGRKLEALRWHCAVQPFVATTGDRLLRARLALAAASISVHALQIKPAEVWPGVQAAETELQALGQPAAAYCALYMQFQLATRLAQPMEVMQAQRDRMLALVQPGWSGRARSFVSLVSGLLLSRSGRLRPYADHCRDERARALADDDASGARVAAYGLAQALWALGEGDAAITVLDQTLDELRSLGLLRENGHFAALATSLRLGRDATPETLTVAREAADLARAEGLLWTLGDALALLPARQQRWHDALQVKAWTDARVAALGESRGPTAASLHRLFDQLRQAAAEQAPADVAAAPLTDADVLRLVFG